MKDIQCELISIYSNLRQEINIIQDNCITLNQYHSYTGLVDVYNQIFTLLENIETDCNYMYQKKRFELQEQENNDKY